MSVFIKEELSTVQTTFAQMPDVNVITCVPIMVRIQIKQTERKDLTLLFQFPDGYPHKPILIEAKSKSLSDTLLGGLNKLLEDEANKHLGQQQIKSVVLFGRKFLEENTLAVCHDEIMHIKRTLLSADDEIKLKQKNAQIVLKLKEGNYFIHVRLTVTEAYPTEETTIEIIDTNFPPLLKTNFTSQSLEIARKCVQPPLKKNPKNAPFEPKPAILPVCKYLITDIIRRYPHMVCHLCHSTALPADPAQICTTPKADLFVERVYCGHLFHHKCLDAHMKTPPFESGKPCPAPGCGNRIYHLNWHISPQVAEARWAAKEAKRRELDEVADFFQ